MLTALAVACLSPITTNAGDRQIVVNIIPGEACRPIFEQVAELQKESHPGGISVGIGAIFSYLLQPREQTVKQLNEFLALSEKFNIPVVVQLDGEQWWEGRPDLWNWWDPSRPGFNPANRENVEWYDWGPQYALKIAWRNWGKQIRVLPPPNLLSPRYRAACHDEMRVLVPALVHWWQRLPETKKGLLIGLKLGWESSIGVNGFYLPNGNNLLDSAEASDPHIDLNGQLIPDRGVWAVGYAAVTTAGMAERGILQEAHLAEVVRRHLDDLCKLAAELGVPRERLFTHVGGWKEEELLYDAAVNAYSCPGWSFYRHAGDGRKDKGVERALRTSNAPSWAAVEWMLMGEHNTGDWVTGLTSVFSIPKCRYVCIYNWSGIRDNKSAVDAIKWLLSK